MRRLLRRWLGMESMESDLRAAKSDLGVATRRIRETREEAVPLQKPDIHMIEEALFPSSVHNAGDGERFWRIMAEIPALRKEMRQIQSALQGAMNKAVSERIGSVNLKASEAYAALDEKIKAAVNDIVELEQRCALDEGLFLALLRHLDIRLESTEERNVFVAVKNEAPKKHKYGKKGKKR